MTNITMHVEPCPCGRRRPYLHRNAVAKNIVSVRCDSCGRKAPDGLTDAFAIRNWNAAIADEVKS